MLGEQARYRNNYMVTEVCVDARPDGDEPISGYLIHKATNRAWRFKGLVDMMKHFEKLFNSENYPQATHKIRGMEADGHIKETVNLEDIAMDANELKNNKPTFVINVQYRQNATWQGTIKWLEGNKEAPFRSELEMIKLMDSVIGSDDETGWK